VVGRTGVTFGPHLYFGMFVGGRPVDPAPYLNLPPCASGEHVTVAGLSVLSRDGKILPSRAYAGAIPSSQGLGATVHRASARLR
jgi:hypothetical protein